MDRTVPAGAAILLDFIRKTEVGTEGREGYDVIYSFRQNRLPKPITEMSVAELQAHQGKGWPAKSTASGGYQFMRATLADLRRELGLLDGQVFGADLQDRLGYHLLKRRGYGQYMAGDISRTEFGDRLAMEWASFPVLQNRKGAHRTLKRGQSYYAGDSLNKALVKPEQVERVLDAVLAAGNAVAAAPKPQPAPVPPPPDVEPVETPAASGGAFLALLQALLSLFRK